MSFLQEVERKLDLPSGQKAEVMRELTSHYEEIREELLASGTPEAQVDGEAESRLGSPEDVAARLSAVHNVASWKSAALCAAPFALAFLGLLIPLGKPVNRPIAGAYALIAVILVAGSVRELMLGRRPVWLASWLAGAWLAITGIPWGALGFVVKANPATGAVNVVHTAIVLGIVAAVVMAAWRHGIWRYVSICCGKLFLLSKYCMTPHLKAVYLVFITLFLINNVSFALLIVSFAVSMFMFHRYGSTSKATLFLLVFSTLNAGFALDGVNLTLIVASALVAVVSVVSFARAAQWQNKLMLALSSVILSTALRQMGVLSFVASVDTHYSHLSHLPSYAFEIMVPVVTVLAPVIYERFQQRDNPPQIAQ